MLEYESEVIEREKLLKFLCAFDFVVQARMKSLLTAYFYKIDRRRKGDEDE